MLILHRKMPVALKQPLTALDRALPLDIVQRSMGAGCECSELPGPGGKPRGLMHEIILGETGLHTLQSVLYRVLHPLCAQRFHDLISRLIER
jgi:hypothetical protein